MPPDAEAPAPTPTPEPGLYAGRPVSGDPPVGSRRPNKAVSVVLGLFIATAIASIVVGVLR